MDGSQNSRPTSKIDIIVKNVLTSLGSIERRAECRSDFSNLKTDQERVKFAITLSRMKKMLSLSLLPDPIMKTVSGAEDYRKMGNGLYCGRDVYNKLDQIIAYYTQSITLAPQKSEALALGYANRSAALFDARVYRDSLQDIARALELPYPDHLKTKIYIRQARCLMVLRKSPDEYKNEIEDALKGAYEYLSSVPLGSESRRKLEEMLESGDITPTKREFIKWQDTALMPSVADENPELKGVSSALELKYDQINGRHTVAARDIDPGEVLAVLKPYAAILTREKKFTHCAYCMKQTWSSLPCETCCEVVYCGESCRSRAYEEYHDIECQVIRYLSPSDTSVHVLFGIRLLVKAFKEAGSIQALRNKIKEIESCTDPIKMGFTQGRLDGESYAGIYTLITNTEKRSFERLFTIAVHASFALLSLATKTKLFGQNLEAEVESFEGNDDVTFIGGLIMRHMLIVDHNAHCLLDVDDFLRQLKRGAVVLAFSQMNHSCNFPGVIKSSYGMYMVYHSNFPIKKGEQVYDNYGFPFDYMERTMRRSQLKEKYCFDCDCIACTENWPLYDELELTRPDLDDESQQNLSDMIDNLANLRIVPDQSAHITKLKDTIAELNGMIILLDEEGVKMPCPGLIKVITTRNQLLLKLANRSQSLNYM